MHCATLLSSRLIAGTFAQFEPYANSFNLSLLAQAVLLWDNLDGGRAMALFPRKAGDEVQRGRKQMTWQE